MKAVIVTALWKRPIVSHLFFEWHAALSERAKTTEIDMPTVVVVTTPEDYAIAKQYDVAICQERNEQLGHKWNHCMEFAGKQHPDADAFIVIGSDDFMSLEYLQNACHLIREGGEYGSARTAIMLDGNTGRMVQFRGNITLGGGRIVTRQLMEKVGFSPWEPSLNKALDSSFDRSLRIVENMRNELIRFSTIEGPIMTIKSEEQIWTFNDLMARTLTEEVADYEAVRGHFNILFDKLM